MTRSASLFDLVVTFGRVLRRAGIDIGSDQILVALRAVDLVGVERKDDFYQALFSAFVREHGQIELFDRAFHLFWRGRSELPDVLAELLSQSTIPPARTQPPSSPAERTEEAAVLQIAHQKDPDGPEAGFSAATYSPLERLKKKDFAEFTADEMAEAHALIQGLRWPFEPQPVRRFSRFRNGRRFDVRSTIRGGLRRHGEIVDLRYGGRKQREQPVVLLCDISGSMELYSRMLLRFMHAVASRRLRFESFVFATRLTRITRQLARRDVRTALAAVSDHVEDWDGGTRIGESIKSFNYDWLRRVLRSRGVVLIISDGCDRGDPDLLEREMARLARSCRSVYWLNPLLRYENYEPLTRGMQAALPYIDGLLPIHNLESLAQLGVLLSRLAGGGGLQGSRPTLIQF